VTKKPLIASLLLLVVEVGAATLFFDARPAREKPWTETLWVFDYRTNIHHTQKTKPLKRPDLDEFVECYNPKNRHERKGRWSEKNPEGRWRSFTYDELAQRDKLNLDIFWIKDKSLEDADSLPEPDELAQEIAADLQAAMELFATIANGLKD
jgi:type I restriction enzyme M protein